MKNALNFIVNKFSKPPSAVVNAAGITRDNFLLQMSQEEFDDVIRVNLKVSSVSELRNINLFFSFRGNLRDSLANRNSFNLV